MSISKKLSERFEVTNNQIPIKTLDKIVNWLIKFNGQSVKLTLESIQDNRTLEQNRYYWELLEIVSQEVGETKEDLHDLFKFELLSEQKEIRDKVYLKDKSTTVLTKEEFMIYIESCKNLIYDMFPEIKLPDYVV